MAMLKENKLHRGFRVFENGALDWLSRAHPAIPAVTFIPIAAASTAFAAYLGMEWYHYLWSLPAGFLVWTLAEYWLHRSFFHWRPNSRTLARMQYWVHEHHHRYQEWDRLVAPPMMAAPIFAFFLVLFWFAFGGTIAATWMGSLPHPSMFTVIAGFIVGYLVYDYTHFATHFMPCKGSWMKTRRKLHYQHHFAFPDRWFGISMPLWDYVFGTYVKAGEKSRNAKPNREAAEGQPPHAMDVYAEYVATLVQRYAEQDQRAPEAEDAVQTAKATLISERRPAAVAEIDEAMSQPNQHGESVNGHGADHVEPRTSPIAASAHLDAHTPSAGAEDDEAHAEREAQPIGSGS